MDLSLVNILARESELEHPLVVCLVSEIPPLVSAVALTPGCFD